MSALVIQELNPRVTSEGNRTNPQNVHHRCHDSYGEGRSFCHRCHRSCGRTTVRELSVSENGYTCLSGQRPAEPDEQPKHENKRTDDD